MSTSEEIKELRAQIDRIDRLLKGEPEPDAISYTERMFTHCLGTKVPIPTKYINDGPVGLTVNNIIVCDYPGYWVCNIYDKTVDETLALTAKVNNLLMEMINKYPQIKTNKQSFRSTLSLEDYTNLTTSIRALVGNCHNI